MIAAGFDTKALGAHLMQSFLRHAMRDGFFHADLHPGNLFVDDQGRIVAVDFGIMGRLGMKERLFLAEILHGFITRNYRRVAEVHFEAGYVPRKHSVAQFAQALRAIGEPIMDRPASEISMAQLLGQLFQYTEVFDMQTRPELLLLAKDHGRRRRREPLPRSGAEYVGGLGARGEAMAGKPAWHHRPTRGGCRGCRTVGRFMGDIPKLLGQVERVGEAFAEMAEEGLRLDDHTVERLAEVQNRQNRWSRIGIWVGAIALAAIALTLIF